MDRVYYICLTQLPPNFYYDFFFIFLFLSFVFLLFLLFFKELTV